ncbi:MAG: hypothetical protein ACFE96_12440 [Candidatus Hermodarchaeota archaeon]
MENNILKLIRRKGGYFGIVGAIAVGIATLFSYFYNNLVDPSFNIISRAVSDLVSGPKISSVTYSIGLITASFCQYPLYFSLIHYLRQDLSHPLLIKTTMLGAIISIVSHNIVSIIPFERNIFLIYLAHGIAAGIHYVGGSITLILYGILEVLSRKVSKIYSMISFLSGGLYGLVWIGYLLSFLDLNHAVQWIAFAGVILWSFLQGILLIRAKKHDFANMED